MRFASFAVLAVLMASGCATVIRGSEDTLNVQSSPSDADVRLSNGMTGKTPATFKLPRKHSVVVTVSKECYKPAEVTVVPLTAGEGVAGMGGNVLIGGIIGIAVDASSGAMYDLKPNPVIITLLENGECGKTLETTKM